MRRMRTAGMLLAGILFFVVPAAGQIDRTPAPGGSGSTYTITGTVRIHFNNSYPERITVYLREGMGQTITSTYSGSNGDFTFSGVSPGVYYVEVEEKGYLHAVERVEITRSDRRGVLVTLRKPLGSEAELPAESPGPAVSVRELALKTKVRETWYKAQDLLYHKNDAEGSLKEFAKVLKADPTFYEVHYQIGNAYRKLEKLAEARESYQKAIDMGGKSYAQPRIALAGILADEKDYATAATLAQEGVDSQKDSWVGYFELGRARYGLGETDAAEAAAVRSRDLKPDQAGIYLLLANIYNRKRDKPALVAALEEYLKLDPAGPMSEQVRQKRDETKKGLPNGGATQPNP